MTKDAAYDALVNAGINPETGHPFQEGEYVPSTGVVGLIERGPGEFIPEEQPGFRFGYEEFVEKPTSRLAAARGRFLSGRTGKELTRYASDYASLEYDKFLNRWLTKEVNPRMGVAGLGLQPTLATGQASMNVGQGMAQNALYGGAARASGYIGQGNAISGGLQNVGNWLMSQYGQGQANNALSMGAGMGGPTSGPQLTSPYQGPQLSYNSPWT
jgi:hypothetical protein